MFLKREQSWLWETQSILSCRKHKNAEMYRLYSSDLKLGTEIVTKYLPKYHWIYINRGVDRRGGGVVGVNWPKREGDIHTPHRFRLVWKPPTLPRTYGVVHPHLRIFHFSNLWPIVILRPSNQPSNDNYPFSILYVLIIFGLIYVML